MRKEYKILALFILACLMTLIGLYLLKNYLSSKSNYTLSRKDISIYMAAPMFTTGQRFENSMIAEALIMEGYTNVFLPQKTGIDDLIGLPLFLSGLAPFDKMDADTKVLWGNYIWPIIYCLDLYDLTNADIVVLNANGQCPDSGAMVEAGLAAAMGKPIVIYFTEYDKTLNPMVAGVTGNFSILSASNFQEVPKIMKQVLKNQKSYNYNYSPNLKNYRDLGKLITQWKSTAGKLNQYDAFKSLISLVTQGKGKSLMQKLSSNPTTVSPTFQPEVITNKKNGRITGTTFTAKLK